MARPDLVDTLRSQVEDSIAAGAEALIGGFEHDGPGAFVDPLVLTGVEPDMRVFREETFGPVAAMVRVARRGGGDRRSPTTRTSASAPRS